MLRQLSKRMLIITAAISIALSAFAIWQTADSYADETSYPTMALNVKGATEDVTWRVLKTQPFYNSYYDTSTAEKQAEFEEYQLGTPIEKTWTNADGVVPWWSVSRTELLKCGTVSGVSVAKTDGTVLNGVYAQDFETAYNGSYISRERDGHDNDSGNGRLTIDGKSCTESENDWYAFSGLHYRTKGGTPKATLYCSSRLNLDSEYAEVYFFNGDSVRTVLPESTDNVSIVFTVYFNGAERELDFDESDMELEVGGTSTRVAKPESSYYGDAIVEYASDNEDVATVDAAGEVTAIAEGEANITASIKDGDKETSKQYKVIVSKASDPAVDAVIEKINTIGEVTLDKENAIAEAREAFNALTDEQKALVPDEVKTTLENAEKTVAALQLAAAKVAAKKAIDDKYDLTKYSGEERTKLERAIADAKTAIDDAETVEAVDAAKTAGMAAADAAKTDEQIAKEKKEAEAEKIKKQKAAAKKYKVKNLKVKSKSRKFTVSWKKTSGATGYQVQYKLKSAKKYKTLKTLKKLKVTSKKLKKGKKYQFKVRTYTNVNGTKVYGKWTKVKTVKCK